MESSSDTSVDGRFRKGARMVLAMVRLHPRPFITAVIGAAIFATCTVLSSVAVRWVTDNVILPRFDEGEVATSTLVTGVVFLGVVGVIRAGGVVMRRVFAGITQFRVGATLSSEVIDRLIRQPISWHQRRPDGDLVGRGSVDTDTAIAVLAPIPYSTGTVLDDRALRRVVAGHRRGPRAGGDRPVPGAAGDERRLPAACRSALRYGTGRTRPPFGECARELRGCAAGQGLWRRATRD